MVGPLNLSGSREQRAESRLPAEPAPDKPAESWSSETQAVAGEGGSGGGIINIWGAGSK